MNKTFFLIIYIIAILCVAVGIILKLNKFPEGDIISLIGITCGIVALIIENYRMKNRLKK